MSHAELVAAWSFNEGTGDKVTDITGNGNDGNFIGSPNWVSGRYGMALEFDGSSNYVEVPDSDFLDITENFTWAAWFKPSVAIDSSNAESVRLMSKNNAYFLLFNYQEIGNLGFLIKTGGANFVVHSTTNTWNADEWYHVAGTYDTEELKIYINGILENTVEHDGTIDATDLTLWIGADDLPHYFPGVIDDVGIYNSVLTEAGVQEIMTTGVTAVESHGKLASTWGDIKSE
jgi:hypothetical protein